MSDEGISTQNRADFTWIDYVEAGSTIGKWFGALVGQIPFNFGEFRTPRSNGTEQVDYNVGVNVNLSIGDRLSLINKIIGYNAENGDTISRFIPSLVVGGAVSFGTDWKSGVKAEIGLPSVLEEAVSNWENRDSMNGKADVTLRGAFKFESHDSVNSNDPISPIDTYTKYTAEVSVSYNGGAVLNTGVSFVSTSRTVHDIVDGKMKTIVIEKRTTTLDAGNPVLDALGITGSLAGRDEWYIYDFNTRQPYSYNLIKVGEETRILIGDKDISSDIEIVSGDPAIVDQFGTIIVTAKKPPADLTANLLSGGSINTSKARSESYNPQTGERLIGIGARDPSQASAVISTHLDGSSTATITFPGDATASGVGQRFEVQIIDGQVSVNGSENYGELGESFSQYIKAITDSDPNAPPPRIYSTETGIGFGAYDKLSERNVEYDLVGGVPYRKRITQDGASFWVEISLDANGKGSSTDIHFSDNSVVEFSDLGGALGSTFGSFLAGGDQLAGIVYSSALQVLGSNLGDVIDGVVGGEGLSTALSDAFSTFPAEIRNAGISAISSYITAELFNELGLTGLPGSAANSVASFTVSTIALNLVAGRDALHGLDAANFGNIAAAFAGNTLANKIGSWDEVGEQLGSAVGSTLGSIALTSTAGAGLITSIIGQTVIPVPIIGAFIGSLLGNLLGGLIGGIFTGTPKSGAIVEYDPDSNGFAVTTVWKEDGGKRAVARQLGDTAAETMNQIIDQIGGTLVNSGDIEAGSYGMRSKKYVYWLDGTNSGNKINFREASDLIEYGVMKAARDFQFVGGDIFAKRAFYQTVENGYLESSSLNDIIDPNDVELGQTLTNVDFGLDVLLGNFAVVDRLRTYLSASASINAMIAAEPDSVFAADWILALTRVQELGLLTRNAHDWDGGFSYLINSSDADAGKVSFKYDLSANGRIGERLMFFGSAGLADTVDTGSKTSITGTADDDFLSGSEGGSREGPAKTDINFVANVIRGGSGDDRLLAGDSGDDLFGGDGDDLLTGGVLDDWLFGGSGNDILDAGGGSGNVLMGGSGDDQLVGTDGVSSDPMNSGSDWLLGEMGEDRLFGQGGDDYLEGGAGADFIEGGAGSDTIIFRLGDGIDKISDNGLDEPDFDVIEFEDGISADDVEVVASSSSIDISILLGDNGDRLDLRGAAATLHAGVEAFDFGTTILSRGQITAQAIFARNAGVSASGTGIGETVAGTRYDDTLSGGDGDALKGGFGSDVYLFSLGDGTVVIEEAGYGSDLDVLAFGAGITAANITVSHSAAAPQDIVITVGTGGDQIILRNQLLKSGAQSIEEVRFQDGTSLTVRDIEALAAPVFTNGNDTAFGFDTDDVFSGGNGSDTLAGGRGNDDLIGGGNGDTFIYNPGDGDDRISDGFWDDGTDTLILGAGIAPEDLILTRDVLDSNNLRLRFRTGPGSILLDGQNSGRTAGIEQIQFANGTIWDRATMDAQMVAQSVSAKADIVRTGYVGAQFISRDDVVSAGAGNDVINTGQGVDIITGGAGDDDLAGGSEADTYVYNIGDGDDRIVEGFWDDGTDTLLFGEDILPEELILSRDVLDGNNLRITFANRDGSILIDGHTSGRTAGIEQIQFADGTIWDRAAIDAQFLAQAQSSANDIIRTGYFGAQYVARDDVILAGDGRDTIYAGQGADLVAGGVGNDELFGGEDGDTYIYNIGDGDDRIADEYWGYGVDALQFGAGINTADLVLSRDVIDPGNLRVSFLNQTGSILIDGQFAGGRSEIEEFRFADGTIWNAAAISAQIVVQMSSVNSDIIRDSNLSGAIQAGAGNDTIYTGGGADVITGGIGNDDLFGGEDGDTYVYNFGDGHDRIAEDYWGNGDDLLLLGEGIDASNLVLTTDVLDGNNLRIDFVGQAGSVLVEGQFNQGRNGLEKIQFADGTIWDRTAISSHVTVRAANIIGTNGAETLSGTAGIDQFYAYNGNDTLAGGTGDDFLNGGGNDDVYLFNLGDGSDTISDDSGTDTIRFGTGISSTDLVLMAPTVDDDFQGLIIAIAGTQDRIYIRNQNANNGRTIERFEFADGTVLTNVDLRTQLMASLPTSGDDKIRGSEFAETINGGAGDDEIDAYSGADIISGGLGNDYLNGGGGEDVYLFNLGDGFDTINDDSGTDTLRFGTGISSTDLVLMAPTVDDDFQGLIIAIAGTQDRIYIRSQNANNGRTIERFEFADGTILTNADLRAQLMASLPTSGDDKIRGSEFAETINGGAGDDEIDAYSGADIISGGLGNDYLNGGGGEDVYLFNLGDGSDTINDDSGTDTLRFGTGISSADLVLMAPTVDDDFQGLIIAIAGTQDRIYIRNQNANNGRTIERFEFADGTVLTNTDLRTQLMAGLPTSGDDKIRGSSFADTISGGSGSDEIEGFDGNDILAGGKGDDYLNGGANDDTYIFNRHDGFETIFDDWGNDTLKLGAGIAESDVIISQALDDGDTSGVILTFKGSDDKIYLRSELDGNRIDTIQFHTGETWNVANLLNLLRGTTINGKFNPVTMGDDVIIGSSVADTIRGMKGDDALRGGMGSDTYRFARGDGYDTIYDPDEAAASDVLILEGINSGDVTVMVAPTDADDIILYIDDENVIYLDQNRTGLKTGVDEIRFADGAIWDRATLLAKASGGQGTSGNDLLIGSNFADTLTGGAGDDRLVGGAGNDIFVYNSGDGNDVIVDVADDADPTATIGNILSFGPGIALADIRLTRNTADGPLIISFAVQTGSVTLERSQSDSLAGIQFLKFADGSMHSMADIRQAALTGQATSGNDLIEGYSTADTLTGGAGNDTLIGHGGADTYLFALGDGEDTIIESDGAANKLVFGTGIATTSLRLYRTIEAPDDLIIALPNGTDSVVLKDQLSSSGRSGVTRISFADGTVWDRDEIVEQLLAQPATPYADYLVGSDGNDSINGLAGNDFIEGAGGDDQLTGGDGNDILSGGVGNDALHGGEGDDVLSGDEGVDTLDGGNGFDTADYGFSLDSWNINLAAGTAAIIRTNGSAPVETLTSIEAVIGGLGSDQITGDDGANRIQGGAGNDILQGGGGDDVFVIGGDEDGIDAVDGGSGYDRIEAAADDTVIGLSSIGNVELITSNGHANVRIEATDEADTLDLSAAELSGIVSIDLGAGNDVVTGTLGADVINAGAGDDVIRYVGLETGADTLDGGDGSDRIEAAANDVVIRLASYQNIEAISGGQFTGVILARTDAAETTNLNGLTVEGLSRIDLEGGDDIFVGTAQADVVRGGSGNDTISGNGGDDIFDYVGVANGFDTLSGGDGFDIVRASADNVRIGIASLASVERLTGNGHANVVVEWGATDDVLNFSTIALDGLTLETGAGNDSATLNSSGLVVAGGAGNDTFTVSGNGSHSFRFGAGDGNDVLTNPGSGYARSDLLQLTGLSTGDVSLIRSGDQLKVTITATGESFSVANQFSGEAQGAQYGLAGIVFADGTTWDRTNIRNNALILGTAGNDTINLPSLSYRVRPSAGNDTLAVQGNGFGTIEFSKGDGNDVLNNSGSGYTRDDTLYLKDALPNEVSLARVGDSLTVTINSTGDTFKSTSQFWTSSAEPTPRYGINRIQFADGTIWNRDDFDAPTVPFTSGNDNVQGTNNGETLRGGVGDDLIYAYGGNDTIFGDEGQDTINGGEGNDLIKGGAGNDLLYGQNGDDTYVFETGHGRDTITDDGNGNDTIQLGAGIAPADVTVMQADNGNDLVLLFSDGSDRITLNDTMTNGYRFIERVTFADGTIWTHADLVARSVLANAGDNTFYGSFNADALLGGAGNDVLVARGGNDALAGGTGNDTLYGNDGDDIYAFALGDGQDTITDDGNGNDTIQLGAGIAPGDVTVVQADTGNDLVLLFGDGSDRITLNDSMTNGYRYIERVTFADGTIWTHADLVARSVLANAGDDTFYGSFTTDSLTGGAGEDVLVARGGNDMLVGGAGNDTLYGNDGDDIYVFAAGDGQDTITDDGNGNDTIQLGAGITPADVTVVQADTGNDLVLLFGDGSDRITLNDSMTNGYRYIERVSFADGTIWTHADLVARSVLANAGDDTFYGSFTTDSLSGGAGEDVLVARGGNDALTGGAGNDTLYGNDGDDTYVFVAGGGQDTITDDGNGNDTIQLGAGIAPGDVTVVQADTGNDLVLLFGNGSDRITLNDTMTNGYRRIERVTFADGTIWTHADLVARSILGNANDDLFYGSYDNEALAGGAGADILAGRGGNDVLTGGSGNDILYGNDGNDTYIFNAGDGQDLIRDDGNGSDTLQLGIGIAPGDVTVVQADNGNDLVLLFAGGSDRITLDDTVNNGGRRIEQVTFADGTVWTHANLLTLAASGTSSDIQLAGTSAAETLTGGVGNDVLNARNGNDILIGGTGNDFLVGGGGDDVYRFNLGDGQDIVREYWGDSGAWGTDAVEFGAGITAADVTVSQGSNGGDLILAIAGTNDMVTLQATVNSGENRIEQVRFADGTIWTHAELMQRSMAANSGDDNFAGSYDAETLTGGSGNDVLNGRGANDILIGGTGNDFLVGGGGDDIYRFNLGDGQDIVREYWGDSGAWGTDTVEFGIGIAAADITVSQGSNGGDLILAIAGTNDKVTLQATVNSGENRIDQVRFADGTVWNHAELMQRSMAANSGDDIFAGSYDAETLTGDAGNDVLNGRGANDILIGGTGNDFLVGGGGDDIYRFNLGDGQDIVREYWGDSGAWGTDTVEFGVGILSANVTVSQGSNGGDLILAIAGTNDKVTLQATVNSGENRIDQVRFADGTVWNHAELMQRSMASNAGDDSFAGSYDAETLNGGAGNDVLNGRGANDILIGGTGNDFLVGGGGDDIYRFNLGDGQDVIREYWGDSGAWGTDTVEFGVGIAAADVTVSQGNNGNDLILAIAGTNDKVTLQATVNSGENRIDQVRFADGTIWNHAQLMALSQQPTAGDDVIYGYEGADTMFGGTGDDQLFGGSGDDILSGEAGHDSLSGGNGTDIAKFAGVQASYSLVTASGSIAVVDNSPTEDGDDGIDTLTGIEKAQFKGGVQVSLAAPIVLDLDGDGIDLVARKQSHARFDWNGDGFADRTGWVGEGDGLLFYDRDGNGTISGANELSFVEDKPGAKSDLDGLSAFDTNGDGRFDTHDDEWSKFGIWQDADGDGVAASDEMSSMADVGIRSISLAGQATAQAWSWDDNIILNHGGFTWTDGRTGSLGDVAMNYFEAKVETHRREPQLFASQLVEAISQFGSSSAAEISIEESAKSGTFDTVASHVRFARSGNFN
ncbi:hypothetical protein K9B33_11340 [Sphingobium sp. 3R8]|uniref:calcium-binding protein n=1 Tax=Sphingobium sp. 3R8 TaxID=2874921 RepID=UPI001CCD7D92|nr:calcium-binding protein [Sphingobium sp. 3R8]MBZ9648143.1 hypothetical protein [Sphingobium sp. 3R8]